MRIGQAISADLDAVKLCAKEAYAKYAPPIGKEPAPMIADFAAQIAAEVVHVIVDDGSVLGFIVLKPRDDHVHIENVAAFREQIGRGIGGELRAFAEHEARLLAARLRKRYTNRQLWAASRVVMAIGLLLPAIHPHILTIITARLCVGGAFMIIVMTGMKEAHRIASHRTASRPHAPYRRHDGVDRHRANDRAGVRQLRL